MPKGWPPNIKPREYDCYDKHGSIGAQGDFVEHLPESGSVRENARRNAWSLQALRDELRKKYPRTTVRIISGYRPLRYNIAIGSTKTSQHVRGGAADIVCRGVPTKVVHKTVLRLIKAGKMPQGGVGYYKRSRFVHVDVRGTAARWSPQGR